MTRPIPYPYHRDDSAMAADLAPPWWDLEPRCAAQHRYPDRETAAMPLDDLPIPVPASWELAPATSDLPRLA